VGFWRSQLLAVLTGYLNQLICKLGDSVGLKTSKQYLGASDHVRLRNRICRILLLAAVKQATWLSCRYTFNAGLCTTANNHLSANCL